jgi:arginyl-tRNA synthetase
VKKKLREILIRSAQKWAPLPPFEIERPKVKEHGELSTNLAMVLAKAAKKNPKELAQEIVSSLKDPEGIVESVTVAGGGFLNFVLKKGAWQESLREIVSQGKRFGFFEEGKGRKVVVEFVSANPTGPLHIGNARGGPLGDVIASLLQQTGHEVVREYYVNDVGGQIDKLGESLLYWIRNEGSESAIPPEGYQGEYVKELARAAMEKLGDRIPDDGREAIRVLGQFGIDQMLKEIRQDCEEMGIYFDSWIHEKTVLVSGETDKILEALRKKNVAAEKEEALWLATQDEFLKDRECVLVRADGRPTYFANDIAYHVGKYKRGFDRIINVWGSNHHGHVPRIKAAMNCLDYDPDKIETVLYQYVRVKRGESAVKMSKRGGTFVTAREVLDEVGRDAFRFFLLMRAPESHLDFDLELAKRHTVENPVYYIQYAHARLASIFRKAKEMGLIESEGGFPSVRLSLLDLEEEIEMIRMIHEYPEEVVRAALRLEPHRIPHYLLELTKLFQSYYTKAKEDPRYKVLSGDIDTSQAKMYLGAALKLTLSQGLALMGISAPEVMVQEA